jgi:hypothetical protein
MNRERIEREGADSSYIRRDEDNIKQKSRVIAPVVECQHSLKLVLMSCGHS